MRISAATLILLALSAPTAAQPGAAGPSMPPPPAGPAEEAPPADGASMQLRAGAGIGRYTESGPGFSFNSDLQPFLIVGGEGVFPAGNNHVVLQASAGFGTDVHMEAKQNGMVFQENRFHQQVFEASPRYRWTVNPKLRFEAGYRLTMQRLFFTDIPTIGDALETVTVHAVEAGLGWQRRYADASRLAVDFVVGLNRGFAENDRIEGEDFSAGGASFNARVQKRWANGLGVETQLAYRKQDGSEVQEVTFDGMQTMAFWPDNVTWQLLIVTGFAI